MKDKEHFPVLSFLFGYFGRLLTRASSSPLLSYVRAPPPRDFTQSHVSHGGTLDTPMGRDDRSSLEVIWLFITPDLSVRGCEVRPCVFSS